MPIIQENPTYFTDRVNTMDMNRVSYKNNGFQNHISNGPKILNYQSQRRGPLPSDDTDCSELEVFTSSCDSNSSGCTDNGMHFVNGKNGNSGSGQQRKGLGQKIGQLFWKSRSKHSVGSESQVSQASGSTVESIGLGSPRFTPDSSLSICTSSLEGADSSHSSSSNQISPKYENRENVTLLDDQSVFYRYDDCERYAANMYYNMGDGSSPYTYTRVQQSRPRNNSVPVSNSSSQKNNGDTSSRMNEDLPYYNNTTFSTFPNHRRHSIAYSSAGSSTNEKKRDNKHHEKVIEQDRDGYLRPNEPRNLRNVKNLYYINEPEYSNRSLDGSRVQVQVDVHTPTSSSLNTEFEALNSPRRHRSFETSAGTTTDDSQNSQSTVVASSLPYVPFYQNGDCPSTSKGGGKDNNNARLIPRDKFIPMYMSRILSVGTDCEPYCSLCVSTTMLASTSKKTRMDVAIVSCQECFFSKNAEAHIRSFFDKLVTSDNQKMDVVLQSYDMKDLEHPNVAAEVHRTKVQIVIISHLFLQRLKLEASTRVRLSPVNRVFRSKRVIAVLVGVNEQEINEGYEAVLARFGEWYRVELRSTTKLDPDFCKRFTEQVVKIYNVELCNTSNFSVFPKKVTREQPKIVVIFKKPMDEGDEIRIDFSCGRKTEGLTSLKMENPYTAIIRVPDNLSPDRTSLIEVTIYVNNHKLGATWVKSEQQSKHKDEDVIERMSNMVPGFLNVLDDHVSQTLSKNYKDCTDYVTDPTIEIMNDILICKGDEFPTIMHFAAYYGLEHTAYTLLDEGDGLEQCRVLNENGSSPSELADFRGYVNTVQIINDYQDISNSMKAFRYMQDLCGRDSVISLKNLKIVSKSNLPKEVIIEEAPYRNEDTINEEVDTLENNSHEEFHSVVNSEDEKGSNAGSYIWERNENNENIPEHYEIVDEILETKKEEEVVKLNPPTPTLRSPRRHKRGEYVNVNSDTRVKENPEEVRRRHDATTRSPKPKYSHHREAVKRHSVSPMQDYDIPRRVNQDYSIPPSEARPVLPVKPPRGQNSPVLIKKVTGSIPTEDGYLFMGPDDELPKQEESCDESKPSPQHYKDFIRKSALVNAGRSGSCDEESRSDNVSVFVADSSAEEPPLSPSPTSPKEKEPENGIVVLEEVDEELVQLMKEFPNSGYSMRQIELLFENWKSRSDVQRSIEDKKKYMKSMRDEYKRIQQQAEKNTKKPSPLDRIKVLIKGRKKSNAVAPVSPVISDHSDVQNCNQFTATQEDIRKLSQSRASDRGSFGSHSSGGSVPDSGVSEPDSEKGKDKERESRNNKLDGQSSPKPVVWSDPLNRRFCPSYIGPDVPATPSIFEKYPGDLDSSYKVPPPARPVTNPTPSIPHHKPSVASIAEYPTNYPKPPPPPKKPSHMQQNQDDHENPPPPPPRNYKPPNVFNYIDYKQKSKAVATRNGAKSPNDQGRPPYDNVLPK